MSTRRKRRTIYLALVIFPAMIGLIIACHARLVDKHVDKLIVCLQDPDRNVRWNAAYDLGRIGDPRSVEPLILALEDADSEVVEHAAGALAKIGSPAVEPLIAALEDGNVAAAVAL